MMDTQNVTLPHVGGTGTFMTHVQMERIIVISDTEFSISKDFYQE
jgi:hypothetical protein